MKNSVFCAAFCDWDPKFRVLVERCIFLVTGLERCEQDAFESEQLADDDEDEDWTVPSSRWDCPAKDALCGRGQIVQAVDMTQEFFLFLFFMIRVERGQPELMIGLFCICHFFPQTLCSDEFSGDILHCFLLMEVTFFHSCFIVFMHLLWNQSVVAIIYHTILESAEMYIMPVYLILFLPHRTPSPDCVCFK